MVQQYPAHLSNRKSQTTPEWAIFTALLELLRRVMEDCLVVEPDGRAVVRSHVSVEHADGEEETYEWVAPGEVDARSRRISPDSPLGAALLGRRADEMTYMDAPAGRVHLTVRAVV